MVIEAFGQEGAGFLDFFGHGGAEADGLFGGVGVGLLQAAEGFVGGIHDLAVDEADEHLVTTAFAGEIGMAGSNVLGGFAP